MIPFRRIVLVGSGLLLAALAIRVAAVLAFAQLQPERVARVWPNHPTVVLAAGLRDIGSLVAAGRVPPVELTARLRAIARRDPLNPEPLLVEGTRAFATGDVARAEAALLAASRLDPIAPAPRFLLADLYFRQGRGDAGLAQVGFLFERLNGDAAPLVPALAQFAAQPGGASRLAPMLAHQPLIRDRVLSLLANDPANLPAIRQIAPRSGPGEPPAEWQGRVLAAMIGKGEYVRALGLWRDLAGLKGAPQPSLFNPRFAAGGPSPPFNWALSSSSAGVAEPQPGGGLHLLYFGRDETVLATQVLLLAPGHYQLNYRATGVTTGLSWGLICLPGTAREDAVLDGRPFTFSVPASGCPAQRLELRGTLGDYPVTADTVLTPLVLGLGGGA